MNGKLTKLTLTIALTLMLVVGVAGVSLAKSLEGKPVTGAISTTDNVGFVGPDSYVNQECQNGQGTNCNIYGDKRDAWLSGLPVSAAIGSGEYFFAVLVPGGQGGNDNPNDGTEKNLSDDYDDYINRTFSVDGDGNITAYAGTHNRDGNKLQLFPYADTTNPGGEYILAVCSLAEGYPVDPSDCKYDAFKIKTQETDPAKDLVITKTATPSYDMTYAWSIAKDVNQTEVKQSTVDATFTYTVTVAHDDGTPSNWMVTGQITVENPNLFDVSGVDVTDAVSNGGECVVTNGEDVTVPGEGSVVLDYVCTYSEAPISLYGINTATATWFEGELKHVSYDKDFEFKTPNEVDECVNVADSMGGQLGTVCVGDANPTSFTYDKTATGIAGTCTDFDNTATFTTNDTGSTNSAQASVRVCVGADPSVSKTAVPFFTRTYNWDITKDVDKTLVEQFGGSATFNYTVNAWQTGFFDSAWYVTGTITVTNPNDWEDITVDLSDAVNNGGNCTLDSASATVPASSSVNVGYACTFSSGDSGTNTATATWDSAAYYTPNGSASGTADFAFVTPTTKVNPTITVTDTFNGGAPTTLGTLTATDAEPYASATYTYSRTIAVPTWNCLSYTNTAKIVETGQSDSETVKVCGPAKTGALTMGFWQNKNGQAIIGSYSGVNCQSLRTWLNGFNPFKDLTSTNCSGVKSYVTNVIKAANASGASMNAMLKAQMLATALDVYFSDPALGGNRIGAPAPIGGVAIDLTKICTDMTCTAFEDSSSVFGGTPKTVLQMLTYAAGQSNNGGSLWYGNVKATQELAKDAFDAINNEKVFAP